MDLEEKLYKEGLNITPFSKRVYAYSIDELLISVIVFISFYEKLSSAKNIMDLISVIDFMVLFFIILKTLYHTIFIHLYGKTIGKIVVKIRVIDIYDLDNPSLKQSFIRAFLRNFDEMFFYLGMLFALTNPFCQTIHDKLSKVVVVDD